jgi:hypothetical protein
MVVRPRHFVGEPRLTAPFLATSNRYARTTKGLLVGVLREMAAWHHRYSLRIALLGA